MKKFLIPICLALCLLTTVIFAASAASSRRELPAGLSDMNGDTSGIRGLSIDGMVTDYNHKYAYTFAIDPQGAEAEMRVHKSGEDVSRDLGVGFEHIWYSNPVYIPVGETKSEMAESESSYRDVDGQWIPMEEHRIYADIFEVVPRMYTGDIPLGLDPSKDKLYTEPAENSYISIVDYNNERLLQYYTPGFSVERSARLHNELTIGDKILVVVTGKGFYGHTALYVVDAPDGHIPTVQENGDIQAFVIANELYPIDLERGDEILGLIELNSGVLLALQRDSGFEFIRIDPETGDSTTVFTEGEPWLNNYYLTDDSLVLVSNYWDDSHPDIHAFDLTNGGLARVMSVESANLWANRSDGIYYDIEAAIWKNGALYIAASTDSAMGGSGPGEVQITALAQSGELIGRCKLLCGIEEDYTMFLLRNTGSVQSDYVRSLKSITLR